ncbi:glutathione S-transferase family protein [Curvivirga sp.]|uniref:glutathione S-transferase family protein n=1 Tax=Curvivirga sp. TaxID=2856848 RepID=UPI003B59FE83
MINPNNHDFHIIGHRLCPYVQQVVIILKELQIPYERTDIILSEKPDWFLKLSPLQQVPVLVINDEIILFESKVILEFLNDLTKNTLHPASTIDRAIHRSWSEIGSKILTIIAHIIYHDQSKSSFEISAQKIRNLLTLIGKECPEYLIRQKSALYMIDVIFSTIFRYLNVFNDATGYAFLDQDTLIYEWQQDLMKNQSVQEAVPDNYHELLAIFAHQQNSFIGTQISKSVPQKPKLPRG